MVHPAVPNAIVEEQIADVVSLAFIELLQCLRYRHGVVEHAKGVGAAFELAFGKEIAKVLGKARPHEQYVVVVPQTCGLAR